jgi:putative effector of murein hydrolase LrgA (UPF0299 family)
MRPLYGFCWLLTFQCLGELLARSVALPFPGPVVGMLMLLGALRWSRVRDDVQAVAEFLLSHLSLLFVPVGVGVTTHLGLLGQHGVKLLLVLVVSTCVGLGVTAGCVSVLASRRRVARGCGEERPTADE